MINKIFRKAKSFVYPDVGKNNVTNREDWLKKQLEKIPASQSILDAGAGELKYKKFCTHLDYKSQDFGQYDGQGNQEGLQMKTWDNSRLDYVCDIVNIPVEDNCFDNIMCIEVFEHLPKPQLAVKEFARIIKPQGKLILTAPFCSLTHFAPYYYANGFSKYWYEKILTENGFRILDLDHNGNYFEYLAQEILRLEQIADKYSEGSNVNFVEKQKAIYTMLKTLKDLSEKNKGSEEILCFGLNVLAEKN